MELKIQDKEIDESLKVFVEKELINPIINGVMRHQIHPKFLQKIIEDKFKEEVGDKLSDACIGIVFGSSFEKKVNAAIYELTEKFQKRIEKQLEQEVKNAFKIRLDNFDQSLKMIDYFIEQKKSDYDNQFFAKYLEGISKVGNIHFEIVHLDKKPDKPIEEFAKEFLQNRHKKGEIKSIHNGKGCPDLLVKNGDETYCVEVKSKMDGIRVDQIRWAEQHPTTYIKFLFFDWGKPDITKQNEEEYT